MKNQKPQAARSPEDPEARVQRLPWILIGLFIAYLVVGFAPPPNDPALNIRGFSHLPVLSGGRTKPLDTIARNSLLMLSGKQTVHSDAGTRSAMAPNDSHSIYFVATAKSDTPGAPPLQARIQSCW